jgi:ABC-2 type transport system permease protein
VRRFRALYGTVLRAIDTRARRFGFLFLAVVGVLVAWAVSTSFGLRPAHHTVGLVDLFNLTFFVPVAALVYGTAAFGDLVDDGTLVYLWLRPVSRARIVVAAYLAALTFVVPVSVVPVVVEALVLRAPSVVTKGAALSAVLAAAAYTALFTLLGLITRRALVWGIGYLLIFESFIARGGRTVGALSIHAHAASVLSRTSSVKVRLAYFSERTGIIASVAIAVVALGLTSWRLRNAEVP